MICVFGVVWWSCCGVCVVCDGSCCDVWWAMGWVIFHVLVDEVELNVSVEVGWGKAWWLCVEICVGIWILLGLGWDAVVFVPAAVARKRLGVLGQVEVAWVPVCFVVQGEVVWR